MEKDKNTREIFLDVLDFRSASRTLNWEFGYWGGTVKRWYREGLPRIKGLSEDVSEGRGVNGSGQPSGTPSYGGTISLRDHDISQYFGFDEDFTLVPYNYWIFPRFEKKAIEEDERYKEFIDGDGIRKRVLKDDSSMPFWLEWPVKERKDWEKMKQERFSFDSIGDRYWGDIESFVKKTKGRTFPLGILGAPTGFFGTLRFLVGEQHLFMLYYDDPKLVEDMMDHLTQLWLHMIEELTEKMDYDIACFWEDMSGKQGSLISPAIFRQFMTPRYKKIIDFLKTRGIKHFVVDTDGDVDELIPLFMEAGITMIYPFEQQAGNDLAAIRKKYPDLVMMGGFDKNTLAAGKEEIDRELEKMPGLIKQGGYIPCADHLVPPNSSWDNFKYYRQRLGEIINSTPVL
jgi:uroporphyrinogen decarboxylase